MPARLEERTFLGKRSVCSLGKYNRCRYNGGSAMTSASAAIPVRSDKLRRAINWCLRRPFTTAAIIYLFAGGLRFMLARDFSEWDHVFVLAARQLRAGADIYNLPANLQEEHPFPYSYPPFQALLAIPFTYLPGFLPRLAWYFVNVICLVVMWRLAWKVSGGGKLENIDRPDWRQFIICILGLACAMRFVEDTLEHRQTDLVIGALLFGGCLAWQQSRDWLAALLWGVAAAFKCTPLLLAGYLLWRRRWGPALCLVLVAIGLNLLPDLVHRPPQGIWLSRWYVQVLRAKSDVGAWYVDPILNQSLAGAAYRFSATRWSIVGNELLLAPVPPRLPQAALKAMLYGVDLLLVAVTALAMSRPFRRNIEAGRAALECSAILILMLMLSPMSHKTHFCILLLPAFCVARLAVEKRSIVAWCAVVICITLVAVLDRSVIGRPRGNLVMWLGSVTWGSAGLWLACLWNLVKRSPKPYWREISTTNGKLMAIGRNPMNRVQIIGAAGSVGCLALAIIKLTTDIGPATMVWIIGMLVCMLVFALGRMMPGSNG